MALKTIKYTVDAMGISPKVRLDGGVQGDHNVTELEFILSDRLYDRLQSEADLISGAKLCYRIDRYNGEGDCESTVAQELASTVIVFAVDEWMTRYGGIIKVVLVISLESEDKTETELYSFPAVLTIKARPTTLTDKKDEYRSLSNMSLVSSESAKSAAADALKSEVFAKAAEDSADSAESFAERLRDAEVIFKSDLGDEGQRLPFELEVDGFLSDMSENPVKNSIITGALNALRESFENAVENIKADMVLAAHPIGSYYWSQSNTSPALLFGGEWERVKDRFVLAAGDTYNEGDIGGVEKNILIEGNLPKNYYFGTEYGNEDYLVQRYPIDAGVVGKESDYYTFVGKATGDIPDEKTKADTTGLKWIYGNAAPIDNMPPYVTAYCWRRTA